MEERVDRSIVVHKGIRERKKSLTDILTDWRVENLNLLIEDNVELLLGVDNMYKLPRDRKEGEQKGLTLWYFYCS